MTFIGPLFYLICGNILLKPPLTHQTSPLKGEDEDLR